MRLFQKTLLLFITIIILLSVSTTVFITRAINTNQSVDASRELAREASAVYDNFNHWKLLLWRHINLLAEENPALEQGPPDSLDNDLVMAVRQAASRSGVDYAVLRRVSDGRQLLVPIESTDRPFLDTQAFRNHKDHPYIEIIKLHNTLYFTAVVRLGSTGDGTAVDVFLVKMIDRPLLQRLSSNQRIQVVVGSASGAVEGSIAVDAIPMSILDGEAKQAYTSIKHVEVDGRNYRAVLQHSGSVTVGDDTEMLTLVVFLSLADYDRQVVLVNRAILTIALVAAMVTILLSLIFSKHLSSPIHRVVQAMQKIKEGDYRVSIPSQYHGEIGELLDGFNEMTEQLAFDKQTREEYLQQIMQLKGYNESIINAMPEGLVVVSKDLRVEKINHSCLQFFSLSEQEVAGASLDTLAIEILDTLLVDQIQTVLADGTAPDTEYKRVMGEQSFEVKLYPLFGQGDIHCIVVIEDISARIAYEQKMFQAERLASMSLMTAGMAHEINNPLSSILSNTQNLIRTETDSERAETLRLVELETKRIAGIVRGLLDFSTTDSNAAPGARVSQTIGEIIRLIGYGIGLEHKITLHTEFDESCPPVALGADELKQVVLNLVRNAMQSVVDTGSITITTRNLPESASVEIAVSDDGEGIPPQRIQRIFDPFYTTKSGDVGTGLGLSVVYGIVKKYKGEISVNSTVGKGTRIAFRLPVV